MDCPDCVLAFAELQSCLTKAGIENCSCNCAAPKVIMQQYLEKAFPLKTDLDNRSMDLLAYQVPQHACCP